MDKVRWGVAVGAIVGAPAILFGSIGAVGLAIDDGLSVAVDERIDAPVGAVYAHLDSAQGIARWWDRAMNAPADPTQPKAVAVVARPGPTAGPGTVIDFVAGGKATETWTVLEVEPDARVVYEVDFKVMRLQRTLTLSADGEGTRVQWSEEGTVDNPWWRAVTAAWGTDWAESNFRAAIAILDAAAADLATTRLQAARAAARDLEAQSTARAKRAEALPDPTAALAAYTAADPGDGASGRASLRPRNPANAGPAWVREWLQAQGGGAAADPTAPYEAVGSGMARVAIGARIGGGCLACHGDASAARPEWIAAIEEAYPGDVPEGYAEGELGGAFWAEVPLLVAPPAP